MSENDLAQLDTVPFAEAVEKVMAWAMRMDSQEFQRFRESIYIVEGLRFKNE